ncbi:hypothetical protein JANAI62_13690 [Jannaschia pagri]|uniref:Phytase-like domain-containing protein n=1 Tax=Jannaschia pagri TaxID=2829797 RepID=A0ABQ4NJZ4_9RHOB|nr:hypothetical protein JANAI61_13730 [Jannaschia sp. AI_61]GIT94746.1 hypothetical protein JANAI62_13690 [Jannaschia sp. AI_62]
MLRSMLCLLLFGSTALHAQDMVPATLAGHAYVPAHTMAAPPADAPRDLWVSGKFTMPSGRNDVPGSWRRPTGVNLPMVGQPFQGISAYAADRAKDGAIYGLIDNGFGSKVNSPDAMLSFVRLAPDFETGVVDVLDRIWLRDPDRVVPFRLSYDDSAARYLTGGDFDLESLQIVGDTVWIGEEFGPYLLSATLEGRITGLYPTIFEEKELRSPDHPRVRAGAVAGVDFTVPRSGGYEGMALAPAGDRLWAMLEKPLMAEDGAPEGAFLRVLAFDPVARD